MLEALAAGASCSCTVAVMSCTTSREVEEEASCSDAGEPKGEAPAEHHSVTHCGIMTVLISHKHKSCCTTSKGAAP